MLEDRCWSLLAEHANKGGRLPRGGGGVCAGGLVLVITSEGRGERAGGGGRRVFVIACYCLLGWASLAPLSSSQPSTGLPPQLPFCCTFLDTL